MLKALINPALMTKKRLQAACEKCISLPNNTPQASPVVRCRDAQTGGFIFFGVRREIR